MYGVVPSVPSYQNSCVLCIVKNLKFYGKGPQQKSCSLKVKYKNKSRNYINTDFKTSSIEAFEAILAIDKFENVFACLGKFGSHHQNNDKITYLQFSVSVKCGAFYISGQRGEFKTKTLLYVFIYFFGFLLLLLLFFIIKFGFLSFSFFFFYFDEVSNFRKRILINQKQELVVQNCQWNCMFKRNICSGVPLQLSHSLCASL